MKNDDNPYELSDVRTDLNSSEPEPPINPFSRPETFEQLVGSLPESSKIRVVPMLAFVVIGLALGQYFISPDVLPRSSHSHQQYRGGAIGGLLGVLLYAMKEYVSRRES